jgi:arylamine N-acetyltransferase
MAVAAGDRAGARRELRRKEPVTTTRPAVDRLLGHLRLDREAPTLDLLDRIICEHQLRVPFETLTKIIDYEPGVERGDFLPPIDAYVDRIVTRGGGGLCWTLARGLQVLLTDLGFDASLMVMVPGHCCVRVELVEGPFYADVGYAAPIFRAYPLFESFSLDTPRERFDYGVRADGIFVTRTPGPAKQLDATPRRIEDLHGLVTAANDWAAPQSFLHRLAYAGYVGGVYTSLTNRTLRRQVPGGPDITELAADDVPAALADIFHADPALYTEAAEIQRRYGPAPR